MRFIWTSVVALALIVVGCGKDDSTPPQAANPATAPSTMPAMTPAAAMPTASREIVVFAAASLNKAMVEIADQFTKAHPEAHVTFNFAGSNALRMQLVAGAKADIFASANTTEMDNAAKANLIEPGTVHIFATNRLALIVPAKNLAEIKSLTDLAKSGVKLVLADPAVPAGNYAVAMFNRAASQPSYGVDFSAAVLKNVQSREENVEAVVTKVLLGEADAGIAYATDVQAHASELGMIPLPDSLNPPAKYPLAVVANPPARELAGQFEDFVMSPAGQSILAADGFTPPAAP